MNQAKQSSFERVVMSRWFLISLLGIAVMVAIGYARAYYEDYKVRSEISSLQQEVDKLEKKKFTSLELLDYVKSDAFVEEKARTELNLKKPGENILALPTEHLTSGPEATSTTLDHVDNVPLSNIKKWWYYFLHQS